MHEQLLGYLLGALESSERRTLERRLKKDPQLRQQLAELRKSLGLLAADDAEEDPPQGLASRTCQFVADSDDVPAAHAPAASGEQASGGGGSWRIHDVVVGTGVLAAAAMLILPAIYQHRCDSRMVVCRDNLREIHLAMFQHAEQHGGFLPLVPASGNLSAAGVYAPTLLETGLLRDSRFLFCPAVDHSDPASLETVTLAQLRQARGDTLQRLQRQMGGDYGYPLGYMEGGRYRAVRVMGRSDLPLMADRPSDRFPRRQSENHGGAGQNLLFEDGHVRFVTSCPSCRLGDDYYLNDDGLVAAGKHARDAVIAPSHAAPIRLVNGER